jgi:membrane protein DedA with SNARE-associated domain
MQRTITYSILIYLTGMLGIWKAVPVGFAVGTEPILTWLMTSLGAITSAIVLYFFGSKIKGYLDARRKKKERIRKKESRALRLFDRYGTAGLGFLGCLLMGPNMTMLIGLVIVKKPRKLLQWTIAGIVIWTLALVILGMVSIDLFTRLTGYFA